MSVYVEWVPLKGGVQHEAAGLGIGTGTYSYTHKEFHMYTHGNLWQTVVREEA